MTTEPPVLRTSGAALEETITAETVAALPLNGRVFVTLTGLAPGVALPPGSFFPRINGGRPRTNEYLFDGISVLQPEPGQVAFFPVIDAIQEFTVVSNSPPAEFGRFNGGVINLTTKAGSNAVRGSGFEFLRNESLNARNYFSSTVEDKPLFRRNQYGGTLGGPVRKDRTFFYVDYQGQRQTIGRTVISTVPTLLQRQGIFTEAIGGRVFPIFDPLTGNANRTPFPGGTIPSARMDPVAVSLLQRYPLPTSTGTANNFRRTDNETDDQDQFDIRVDHRITGRDRAFVRVSYFRDGFIPVTPLPEGSGVTTGTLGPQDTTAWATAGQLPAHLFGSLVERSPHRRHATRGRADSRGVADVSNQWLPATRCSAEHGVGLRHVRDRDRRLAELAEGPALVQGGIRLAVGTAERHPAAVADGILHVHEPVLRQSGRRQHGDAARELPARPGADVLDRPAAAADPQPRALPGVLHPGRLEDLRSTGRWRRACATR